WVRTPRKLLTPRHRASWRSSSWIPNRSTEMTELNSELLPVLPLDDVVVLPHMTVTLALADDAQRAAVEAAGRGNRLVLLVPRVEGRFARMGTVARLESSG